MTDVRESVPLISPASTRRSPFASALAAVVAAWLLAAMVQGLLFVAFGLVGESDQGAAAAVGGGSGLVAVAAMTAGLLLSRSRGREPTSNNASLRLMAAAATAMFLRLAGTVALFLTCRYHMAAATDMVLWSTVGWYVYLTTIEVFVLAREFKHVRFPAAITQPSLPSCES